MTFPVPGWIGGSSRPRWHSRPLGLIAFATLAALAYLGGPRNELGANTPTPRSLPPDQLASLDAWLQQSESAYTDIRPGTAKGIVWASPQHMRTPWAIVYLHGFSSSRLEMAPLPEQLARRLGANLFYARLTGHGRSGPALAEARAQDWMADTLEAVRIGQTLGERVVLVSCSTGSTLATWLGMSPDASRADAHVFISPNFGTRDKRGELINGPWGPQLARLFAGANYGRTGASQAEATAWTVQYPVRALFPMLALVKSVRESALNTFESPVLLFYSEQDHVVNPNETRRVFRLLGSTIKALEPITYSKDPMQHVLAGELRDPAAVEPMVNTMTQWLHGLPIAAHPR